MPDYGTETFNVLIEKAENGKLFEVELIINPYHPDYPGLRMRLKKSKGVCIYFMSYYLGEAFYYNFLSVKK